MLYRHARKIIITLILLRVNEEIIYCSCPIESHLNSAKFHRSDKNM